MKNYRRYPEYKDSGIEWLGEIPVHWKVVSVKRLAEIVNGATPRSSESEYWDGNIAWATPDDLGRLSSRVLEDTSRHITKAGYASCGTTLVPPGSLILSTRAPIGHLAIAGRELCINQGCRGLILNENDPSVYRYYSVLAIKPILQSLGEGSTFRELPRDTLANVVLPNPPQEERKAIADFLDRETAKIDALIEKKERLIELLKEKRTALITHAVTKGLDPNVPMKDSGIKWLGKIPAHWRIRKLKYLGRFIGGGTPAKGEINYWKGDIPWVSPKDMYTSLVTDTLDHITEEAVKESATSVVPASSVLIVVRSGILRHTIPVAIAGRNVSLNQDMKAFVSKRKAFSRYLMYLIGGKQKDLLVVWRKEGATVESIDFDRLCRTFVPLPAEEEQQAIVDFLDRETAKIDALIAKIEEAIKLLKEYRTALISAAVTGKIDVRDKVEA